MFSLTTLYAEMFKIVALFYDFYFFFFFYISHLTRAGYLGENVARCRLASVKSLKLFDYFKHSAEK